MIAISNCINVAFENIAPFKCTSDCIFSTPLIQYCRNFATHRFLCFNRWLILERVHLRMILEIHVFISLYSFERIVLGGWHGSIGRAMASGGIPNPWSYYVCSISSKIINCNSKVKVPCSSSK